MTRVSVEKWIIKRFKAKYEKQFFEEFGVNITNSQIVMIALLHFEAYLSNQKLDIKFMKNGKIDWSFK